MMVKMIVVGVEEVGFGIKLFMLVDFDCWELLLFKFGVYIDLYLLNGFVCIYLLCNEFVDNV